MVNPPTEYKQFIISKFPRGENYRTVKIFNHLARKMGAISRTVRNFNVTVRKIYHRVWTSDKYRTMNKTTNPLIFFK
jgi:hypothetical protein